MSGKLEGVGRHHAIVVIGGGDQGRGVTGTGLEIVQGRIPQQGAKHILAVRGRAVIVGPARAGGKGVVAQHVHHPDRRQRDLKQIGALSHHRANQQAAVGAAAQRQFLLAGVALVKKILGRGHEVVENVLLSLPGAGEMPGLAILATAANIGHGVNSAQAQPRGHGGAEARPQADIKAAVAIQQGGRAAVARHAPGVSDQHGNARAVSGGVKHLLGHKIVRGEA